MAMLYQALKATNKRTFFEAPLRHIKIDQEKYNSKKNQQRFLYTRATCSESPSNTSTAMKTSYRQATLHLTIFNKELIQT